MSAVAACLTTDLLVQPRLVETASAYQLEVDMPTVSASES